MSIKIVVQDQRPENDIKVDVGIGEGMTVWQGNDLVYVDKSMIKLFIAAVNTVGYDILGEGWRNER